jgi:hypothetical protein
MSTDTTTEDGRAGTRPINSRATPEQSPLPRNELDTTPQAEATRNVHAGSPSFAPSPTDPPTAILAVVGPLDERALRINAALLDTLPPLRAGAHETPTDGLCVMEAVAYVAGEPWSDAPACVSPVVAAFCRAWNDALPDDATRDRLLKPLIPVLVGTRTTDADETTRAWLATDWMARVQTPAWLRLAGLTADAQALEACARIVDARDAAMDAVWAAARDAARDAAMDAAWAAASAAAWDAAWDAAGAAAWDAAGDAAWDAAGDAFAPTVLALQASAVELVRTMCAVGRESQP